MAIALRAQRPEPKFTTIQELRSYVFSMSLYSHSKEKLLDTEDFPCIKCSGKGKVRKMEDRCSIEGFKLAPWYNCDFCGGSGKVHPSYYESVVKEELKRSAERAGKYNEILNRYNGILEKIEPEDVEFLLKNVIVSNSQ